MGSATLKQLKDKVLGLSQSERAELAHELLVSLDGPPDDAAPAAWAKEVQRRLDEIDSGAVRAVDSEAVLAGIEKRVRGLQ